MRSIGRATALLLARLGADVVVTGTGRAADRYPDEEKANGWRDIDSVADEIRSLGRRSMAAVLDVTDADAADTFFGNVVKEMGRADILINNAAAPMGEDRKPITEVDRDVFRWVVEVKVMGAFYLSQLMARQLIAQQDGGSIISISSMAGKTGTPNNLAYNAANFALNGMTQSMAKELGPHGITVNAVCPGLIPTARWGDKDTTSDEKMAPIPAGRPGKYEEVAELIAFLCTPSSRYINGQAINIDGGRVTEH
ncbi:MAG: SDR family oxidoreductase [Chloroflexi bacterium]|nr:SDR family oxidoreductase [Chloroflexota bacterium]